MSDKGVYWHMTTCWNLGTSMLSVRDREDNIVLFTTPWFKHAELTFYAEITRRVINMFNNAYLKGII